MAQSDYGNPASPFSGTQLNNRIRDWRDALHTLHRGSSRPTYAQAGMVWIREVSGTQWEVLLYDGADDILIATVNPTTNASTPAIPSAAIGTTQIADGAVTETKLAPGLPFLPASGGTLTGQLSVVYDNASVLVRSAAPSVRSYGFATDSALRWAWQVDGASESGSNAGSNMRLRRYSDAGASLGDVLTVERSSGRVTFAGALPRVPALDPSDPNDVVRKAALDAALASGRRLTGVYVFNSTQNWTRPNGTTAMLVYAIGGGGGGGRGFENQPGGGEGGEG